MLQLVLSWVDGLGSLECEGLGIKSSPGPTGIKATTKGMFSRWVRYNLVILCIANMLHGDATPEQIFRHHRVYVVIVMERNK